MTSNIIDSLSLRMQVVEKVIDTLVERYQPTDTDGSKILYHEIEKKDPWKHRNRGMKCETCMWWVEKEKLEGTANSDVNTIMRLGRCRRHAPTMNGYPAAFGNDWCGDHKLDETKL